ncbi:unnamed protein product [Fusarium equiseti]|uniref:tyrosinase n=1 Tax=Fusarium equiseti TaxID=61235 RepID=A0A8J2IJI8_FUSEQ|nr:unnamed protein product [Fusarium equiseti]
MASSDDHYFITGVQDDLDPNRENSLREVPVRMDVDEWFLSQDPIHIKQCALFFPAFWAFSQTSPHERLSWFQMAGIHGKPFVAWDEDAQEGKTESGYCTHNSILFTTWHRPYMLLWEQVIYEMMKKEAGKFDEQDREQLLEAAKSWRFPFWDWALKKQGPGKGGKYDYHIPLVIQVEEVYIRSPAGFSTVKNAFYQYNMPGGVTMGDESLKNPIDPENPLKDLRITSNTGKTYSGQKHTLPYDNCSSTSRYAEGHGSIDNNWIKGKQNNKRIEHAMRGYEWDPVSNTDNEDKKTRDRQRGKLTASLREAFYRVLTIERFEDFSTKRMPDMEPEPKSGPGYNQKGYAFDSLENIRDDLHGWCGGDVTTINNGIALLGHMSDVTVAAFDPIFWLHYCNIDRLFAMWQMLHDDQWFSDTDIRTKDEGNFWIRAGHPFKSTDELRPFRDENGEYHTSNAVWEVTRSGYTYPGLEKWLYLKPDGTYNKEGHLDVLRRTLSDNYNASWEAVQASHFSQVIQGQNGLPVLSFGEYKENAMDK